MIDPYHIMNTLRTCRWLRLKDWELGEGKAIRSGTAGYLARYLQYERALRACDKSGRNISCGKCEVLDKRDLVPGCLATGNGYCGERSRCSQIPLSRPQYPGFVLLLLPLMLMLPFTARSKYRNKTGLATREGAHCTRYIM